MKEKNSFGLFFFFFKKTNLISIENKEINQVLETIFEKC